MFVLENYTSVFLYTCTGIYIDTCVDANTNISIDVLCIDISVDTNINISSDLLCCDLPPNTCTTRER